MDFHLALYAIILSFNQIHKLTLLRDPNNGYEFELNSNYSFSIILARGTLT